MTWLWFKASVVLAVSAIYLYLCRKNVEPEPVVGKNVLVTGASSGIGAEIAYRYAQLGANVFITARREKLLKKVVEECERVGRPGARFGYVVADMSKYHTSAQAVINKAVDTLGSLDHLILNHAILPHFKKSLWEGDEEELRYIELTMDVNFMSYVYLTSAALPHMYKSESARIGITSSMAGKVESMGIGPYSASKFALDGFFSTLRTELQASNKPVTVTLCPLGFIASKFALDGFFSTLRTELQAANKPVTVTLCPLGFIDTERGQETTETMVSTLNLNKDKLFSVMSVADVTETAQLIVDAVRRGDRELYHPPMLGGMDLAWIPAIRHAAPWILQPDFRDFKND